MQNNRSRQATTMEVLVLGLCRTGTLSMKIALEELGYKNVYHFSTVDEDPAHAGLWIEALRRKYEAQLGNSIETPKTNWNQILEGCNAVTDIPAACFGPELIAAYPDAKIILTTRSAASWQKSMLRTIHSLQSSYIIRLLLLNADQRTKNLSHLMDLVITYYFNGSIPHNGVKVFEKHNNMIKEMAIVEKRECLEFRLGDGWEPLCEFLGKEVPEHSFPRVNDTQSWRGAFGLGWYNNGKIIAGSVFIIAISSMLFEAQRRRFSV
ncbi:hypothetical protein N431DRAFT_371218 [Stipitochalara longipes BDJ]|nr:hypothetical protein N431DRAFT_371218 [Stipitochalara longipes BDJ]